MFIFLCLISLSIMLSRSIHAVTNGKSSFFFTAVQYSIVQMYHNFLIHSSANGHLGCFQILAIVNYAAINIGVHISFLIGVSSFLGYIPKSGITGSNGSSIFSFLRKLHTILHSGCTPTKSAQKFLFLHILASICHLLIC